MNWPLRTRTLSFRRPLVMGILNVTPDSFSDGGRFDSFTAAVARGLELEADGADLLDIGGESTRPGSEPVTLAEELRRVVPVVAELVKRLTIPLSVDTSKAEVARQCLNSGAEILNDVTALTGDPAMPGVCAESGCAVVLMHMQGTPQTMQANPTYGDVVDEIDHYFSERIAAATAAGIAIEKIALDPGIGFGKTQDHNLTLMANLSRFRHRGRPLVLGASRKGFLKEITGRDRPDRLAGTLAVSCYAFPQAEIVRVHDVAAHRDAALVYAALNRYNKSP
jgi:dihydropteroate synthase